MVDRPASGVDRRTLMKSMGAASIAGVTGLSGCLGLTGQGGDDVFKIGGTWGLTGPTSQISKDMTQAIRLHVEQLNEGDGILGNDVEFTVKDDEASPETAVQNAREYVNNDYDVVVGGTSSAIGLAVLSYLRQNADIPMISVGWQSAKFTGEECARQMFELTANVIQGVATVTAGIRDMTESSHTRLAGINPDYTFGHEAQRLFKSGMQEARPDATVVQESYPQFLKGDYQSEIEELMNAEPDIVFSSLWGSDLISFIKQANQAGFFDQVPVFAPMLPFNTTNALGSNMPEVLGWEWYYHQFPDTQANNDFVQAYRDRWDQIPRANSAHPYGAVEALRSAAEKAGSTNPDDLINALEGHTYDAPNGEVKIREADHQSLQPNLAVGWLQEVDYLDNRYGYVEEETNLYNTANYARDPVCEFPN